LSGLKIKNHGDSEGGEQSIWRIGVEVVRKVVAQTQKPQTTIGVHPSNQETPVKGDIREKGAIEVNRGKRSFGLNRKGRHNKKVSAKRFPGDEKEEKI